jgi:hypothetical protein
MPYRSRALLGTVHFDLLSAGSIPAYLNSKLKYSSRKSSRYTTIENAF